METQLRALQQEALDALEQANDSASLEAFRVSYLGRKGGRLTAILRQLGSAAPEDRPRLGQLANDIKTDLERRFDERRQSYGQETGASAQSVDLSLPGRYLPFGSLHPITQVMAEICSIFEGLGFAVAEGPDVEADYYNFEALNIPQHHPARDMHDTFYVTDSILLRTHTSPMQARIMEKQDPPLRYISPGKVYRCDSDITHTPMFHQVEGFLVDRDVSFAD